MALRFGDGPRTVLVVGQTHGDEEGGLRVLLRAQSLPLPDGITLWVVPTHEPRRPRRRHPLPGQWRRPEPAGAEPARAAGRSRLRPRHPAVADGLVPPELRVGGWFGRIDDAGEAATRP